MPKISPQLEARHMHFPAEKAPPGSPTCACSFANRSCAVFAMCGGILLLACMNLASLLMARGAARQPELATRLALGATRRRLIQQLLVESLLIAVMGAVAGLAVAPVVSKSLSMMLLAGEGNRSASIPLSISASSPSLPLPPSSPRSSSVSSPPSRPPPKASTNKSKAASTPPRPTNAAASFPKS